MLWFNKIPNEIIVKSMKRYLLLVFVMICAVNQYIHLNKTCLVEATQHFYFFNCSKIPGLFGHLLRFQSLNKPHLNNNEAKLSLINIDGEIIKQKTTTRNYMTLNVKSYPKGSYTLMVELKEGSSRLKVEL